MLTHKQNELLTFIEGYMAVERVSPSFDEMREACGLKSKSGVRRLIDALVERGFIQRLPNRARAIQIGNPLARFSYNELVAEIERRRGS